MSIPEAKARAGEDVSPAHELAAAMSGFVSELKTFKTDIQTKFQKQEERMTMLDRKNMISGARPALAASVDIGAPHQKAFDAYLRSGDDDGLRGLELEGKSLNTAIGADGGFLVDPQTSATIRSALNDTASIRAISTVVSIESSAYEVLIDHTDVQTGWATETTAIAEGDTPKIDRITIPLHELSALPKASQRLLDDSAFDVDGWLAARIADKFSRSEADAFINGDGIDKPKGFLTTPTAANDTAIWGQLGYTATGTDGAIGNGDALIELVYSLAAEYRAGATFVLSSKTAGLVRKLKDNDGRFLWSDGLAAGEPARLLGYPVLIAEAMPDVEVGSFSIAFGNFAAGYTIAERPDVRVLRDPFSAKPHVLFYATKRVGGAVSDYKAIKVLKFAVS